MISRPSLLAGTVAGLSALAVPAARAATATIVRVSGAIYTIDAGQADGLAPGGELSVLRNGVAISRLRISAARLHESDAAVVEPDPRVVVRLGDTVTYEPSVPPTPPPPLLPPPSSPSIRETPAPVPPGSRGATEGRIAPSPAPMGSDAMDGPPPEAFLIQPSGAAEATLVATLTEDGLENVYAAPTDGGGIYVEFENRRWRWEVDALGVVMREAAQSASGDGVMTVVGKQRGVPAYQVQARLPDFQAFLNGSMDDAAFRRRLRATWPGGSGHSGENHSYGKIDLTLGEGLRGNITTGGGSGIPGIQDRLRLGAETDLTKGLRLRFREWVPLNSVSNFSTTPTVDEGEATFAHRLGPRLVGMAGVGTFREGFSAVRGQASVFPTRDDALVVDFGKVGSGLGSLTQFAYLATWRHQLPKVDAQVFARGGKFLAGDTGGTLGFRSQFRERSYEFAYTKVKSDKLLTFTLHWPLGERKFSSPKSLRLRRERDVRVSFTQKGSSIGQAFTPDERSDTWTEAEGVATLPASLGDYVAFLRGTGEGEDAASLSLPSGMKDVPMSAQIGPSLSGTTGLWFVPAAEVEPYGYWTLGANWVHKDYRSKEGGFGGSGTVAEYLTLGVLPNLELTLRLTNQEGKLGAQRYAFTGSARTSSGWDVDKEVSAQYRLFGEKGGRPAFAVGAQDFAGALGNISTAVQYKAYYGVASKHFGPLGVHLGFGTRTLHGPFAGADWALSPRIRLMGDYARDVTTIKAHKVTAGLRAEVLKNVRLDVYAPGLKTLGAGLTWTRRM